MSGDDIGGRLMGGACVYSDDGVAIGAVAADDDVTSGCVANTSCFAMAMTAAAFCGSLFW